MEREREIYKQRIKMYGRKRGYCKGVKDFLEIEERGISDTTGEHGG